MRLIDTTTLKLEEFQSPVPPYAILSHTWGSNEATMADMSSINHAGHKKKFDKIRRTCSEAARINLKYCWVDTCCIDKASSAELSESINSMFEWYKRAAICYVFLSDLAPGAAVEDDLAKCCWFTRGWTLQELVAPITLVFFDKSWVSRGSIRLRETKLERYWPPLYQKLSYECDLSARVSDITGIPIGVLRDLVSLRSTLAAEVLSWASMRTATRVEDQAYSLMGLLDVNMPLLYGEGQKAFLRLQEEILRKQGDLSLLAWEPTSPTTDRYCAVLTNSPSDFSWCRGRHLSHRAGHNLEIGITNRGLRLKTRLRIHKEGSGENLTEKEKPYGHYFLDLNLSVIFHADREKSLGKIFGIDTTPTGSGPEKSLGLHLLECGPSLFCRDIVGSYKSLSARLDETRLTLHGNNKMPIYLFVGSNIDQVFTDHPFLEDLWYIGGLLDPSSLMRRMLYMQPKNPDPSLFRGQGTQYLYDQFRRMDIQFPKQENMRLTRVANGSLWDETQRKFISTTSNHTGWDALVFHLQIPGERGTTELKGVVLFIFFLKRTQAMILTHPPEIVVLLNAHEDEVKKHLDNAADIDQDELLQGWPAMSQKVHTVLHDNNLALIANPKQPINLYLSHSLWRERPEWQEGAESVSFTNTSLRTEVVSQKWDIEARVCLKPVPGNSGVRSAVVELFLLPAPISSWGVAWRSYVAGFVVFSAAVCCSLLGRR